MQITDDFRLVPSLYDGKWNTYREVEAGEKKSGALNVNVMYS